MFVPDPTPRFRNQTYLAKFFKNKNLYNILPFHCKKQHYYPESLPPIIDFFTFVLHFILDPGPNAVPEPKPECITVSVPKSKKVAVPTVSVLETQHSRKQKKKKISHWSHRQRWIKGTVAPD